MTSTPAPAAIVIAGGRSSRFGGDKLSARVDGRSLLERTLEAVGDAAAIVVVSGAESTGRRACVSVSEYPRWGGPCAAIAAGLAALPAATADTLIVAADLAYPESAVAALRGIESGILADADGREQWLLARVPLGPLRERIAHLEATGGTTGRPARAALGDLGLPLVPASPDAIADIDDRHDLARVKEQH
jgi:molybdopterin-guanine dinucleotide biosynthesis protein A